MVKTAQKIIGTLLPAVREAYITYCHRKARRIKKDCPLCPSAFLLRTAQDYLYGHSGVWDSFYPYAMRLSYQENEGGLYIKIHFFNSFYFLMKSCSDSQLKSHVYTGVVNTFAYCFSLHKTLGWCLYTIWLIFVKLLYEGKQCPPHSHCCHCQYSNSWDWAAFRKLCKVS